jgi:uncharacterized membrane protein
MTYSPLLIVHICGGVIGVLSGSMALFVRKGSRSHRRSGDVFVIAMLCMAASGAYLGFLKSQTPNVLAGLLTFYLVSTAWLTVKRREGETGRGELALLLLGFAAGTGALIAGRLSAHSGNKGAASAAFVFGVVILLSVAGDVRMLIRGGISGAKRMVRHLWRMCFALFVATGSFFLGGGSRSGFRARLFTPEIRKTHLPTVPVLIVVFMTIFWLCRVLFTNAYKKPTPQILNAAAQ